MKVILKEDITNLGYKDDVVEVKSGYGRNYLIPQRLAVIASPSALKVLAENLKQRAHKIAQIKADAEAIAESLKDVSLTIMQRQAQQAQSLVLLQTFKLLKLLRNSVTTSTARLSSSKTM